LINKHFERNTVNNVPFFIFFLNCRSEVRILFGTFQSLVLTRLFILLYIKCFLFAEKLPKMKRSPPKNDLYSYFRTEIGAKSEDILWTTYKDYRTKIQGNGFSKSAPKNCEDTEGKACFIPWTTRATNNYRNKSVLAFCLNRYMNPMEEKFFQQRDIQVDQDLLALSDLLQWVFRSRIREGEPIVIYIPSKRMRTLFQKWLEGEI
jgi:hypothetical protein